MSDNGYPSHNNLVTKICITNFDQFTKRIYLTGSLMYLHLKSTRSPARTALTVLVIISTYAFPAQASSTPVKTHSPACSLYSQAQRLNKTTLNALKGDALAFDAMSPIVAKMDESLSLMESGNQGVKAVQFESLGFIKDVMASVQEAAKISLENKSDLLNARAQLNAAKDAMNAVQVLDKFTEAFVDDKKATAAQANVAGQLQLAFARLPYSMVDLLGVHPMQAEAVFLLGKDANAVDEKLATLLSGSEFLQVTPIESIAARKHLTALAKEYVPIRASFSAVLANIQGWLNARQSLEKIQYELERVDDQLSENCLLSKSIP
jgi:twitching motility protein PilJ